MSWPDADGDTVGMCVLCEEVTRYDRLYPIVVGRQIWLRRLVKHFNPVTKRTEERVVRIPLDKKRNAMACGEYGADGTTMEGCYAIYLQRTLTAGKTTENKRGEIVAAKDAWRGYWDFSAKRST